MHFSSKLHRTLKFQTKVLQTVRGKVVSLESLAIPQSIDIAKLGVLPGDPPMGELLSEMDTSRVKVKTS